MCFPFLLLYDNADNKDNIGKRDMRFLFFDDNSDNLLRRNMRRSAGRHRRSPRSGRHYK